ncbi:hypothetical protein M501DRAFT_1002884 [Patellaria atrata CBS 101060]|uniref:Ribosomal protein S8 n=1 Tax=Patellaria atrata CBS 101060 TaxID=1346257 RepID=A0A9P4VP65_9PEZI|nr:hypothetical protein M501DRAFT_1002884 [Patellaria atrata CBS 101060]
MSLVNLGNICSHLQNASKSRLGLTSIPLTKLHLALALGLQKEGFVSKVTLGGRAPPLPPSLREPISVSEGAEITPDKLQEEPWLAFAKPTAQDSGALLKKQIPQENPVSTQISKKILAKTQRTTPTKLTPQESLVSSQVSKEILNNPAHQRLWLGLKYWNNQPVLSAMSLVSKPTKRIWLNSDDLGRIARGRDAGYVKGLSSPGECLFISTDRGVMEVRHCVEKKIGGMVLCRVS